MVRDYMDTNDKKFKITLDNMRLKITDQEKIKCS